MTEPGADDSTGSPRSAVKWLWLPLLAAVVLTPLVLSTTGEDVFRVPKTAVFQALAMLILAASGALLLFRPDLADEDLPRIPLLVAAASVLWAAIVAMASLKPVVSYPKPFSVFAYAVFFAATLWVARRESLRVLYAVFVPAAFNAVLVILQGTRIWNPLIFQGSEHRLWITGFIGNPNDVACYLLFPTVAAIAGAAAWPRHRWLYALAAVLAAAIVATRSRTGVAALAMAIVALVFLSRSAMARRASLLALLALFATFALYGPARNRVKETVVGIASGNTEEGTAYRLPAWVVATKLFRERPLVGVGPGTFGAVYMSYRLDIEKDHPEWISITKENFGDVHNDHLQLLAEGGIPAYALFLAALGLLALLSRKNAEGGEDRRREFVRMFAFPAAVSLFVVSFAQFPLELTAPTVTNVFLAAVAFAWGER